MRSSLLFGVVVALAASAGPARAQSLPVQAAITAPSVQVRSGPTDKCYPTLELRQGETVSVIRAASEPGWLEIRPPQGSYNWINAKCVKQMGPYWVVVIDDDPKFVAKARVGSEFDIEPKVEAKQGYLAGSILRVVAQAKIDGADTWLPVQPDSRDVRYIPASAVNLPGHPAIGAPVAPAIGSKITNPPTTLIPGMPHGGTLPGSTTSLSPTPVLPAPSITPASPAPVTNPPAWSQWGKLEATTFRAKNGQPVYRLTSDKGTLLYVTSNPGTNLSSYVNRRVCMYGPTVYRSDEAITSGYMVATHVAVP
jgi:hypothetical protein